MLLFNLYIGGGSKTANMFQYISCCCLTLEAWTFFGGLKTFQYISCCCLTQAVFSNMPIVGEVSIHLMLLFNGYSIFVKANVSRFQYISCCCLTNDFKPFLKDGFLCMPLFYTILKKITSDF